MLKVNETRFFAQSQSYECKCRLNESVCNSKQKWNHDEWQCERKELKDWGSCKNDYMWNHSTCNCECNKLCKIDEYLDIKNCFCWWCLFDKFVLAYKDEIINATEIALVD